MRNTIKAVSPQNFAGKTWRRFSDYLFATKTHMVPVVVNELAQAATCIPLGFVKLDASFQLMAIMALQPNTNALVGLDGQWLARYVPAAIRSGPFNLVKPQDADGMVLCFDEGSGLLREDGQGEAFFNDEGKPAPAVQDVITFLSQVERSRMLTQSAVEALDSAGLIKPWTLSVVQQDKTIPVQGLYQVDEAALEALDDAAYLLLRSKKALPLAHAQLLSMNLMPWLWQMTQARADSARAKPRLPRETSPELASFALLEDDGVLKF